jgi:hypothetical protein
MVSEDEFKKMLDSDSQILEYSQKSKNSDSKCLEFKKEALDLYYGLDLLKDHI